MKRSPWGSGEEIYLERSDRTNSPNQWLFFDEDEILAGAVVGYPNGLNLEPYPVLRDTLSQLNPAREFFLDSTNLLAGGKPVTASVYRTGDKTSTTQYIVRQSADDDEELLVAHYG